jgi:transcription elongation factor SPT5
MSKYKRENIGDLEEEENYDPAMFKDLLEAQQPLEDNRKDGLADDESNQGSEKNEGKEENEEQEDLSYREEGNSGIEEDEEEEESSYKKKKKNNKSQLKKKRKREDKRKDKKTKKKNNKSDLIDIEASDDEDEEEEEDDGDAEITVQEQNKILSQYEKFNRSSYQKEKMKMFYDRPEEEIAESYEKMERNDEEFEYASRDDLTQQSKQPSIKDPKLWLVKCKIGKEKEAVQSLYHKYFSFFDTDKALK